MKLKEIQKKKIKLMRRIVLASKYRKDAENNILNAQFEDHCREYVYVCDQEKRIQLIEDCKDKRIIF